MTELPQPDQNDHEEQIRQIAFRLWQADGGPEGSSELYRLRAEEILEEELSRPHPATGTMEYGGPVKDEDATDREDVALTKTQTERHMHKARAI